MSSRSPRAMKISHCASKFKVGAGEQNYTRKLAMYWPLPNSSIMTSDDDEAFCMM